MARNSSGTYSLPAGNPVVSGTTISSTTHNNTMSDLATEVTNSLDRGGRGAMTAPLQLANGTVAAPALTFGSGTDNGFYWIGTDNFGAAVNGVKTQEWAATVTTFSKKVAITPGTGGSGYPFEVTAPSDGSDAANFTGAPGTPGNGIIATGGSASGSGVRAIGGTNGNGITASGTAAGHGGVFDGGTSGSGGVGVVATGGLNKAPLRLTPRTAPSTAAVGDLYADSAGILYICTNATGPVWTKVGTQT